MTLPTSITRIADTCPAHSEIGAPPQHPPNKAGGGTEQHTYVGPLLIDVLKLAGPQFDPAIKNDKLRHFVSVSATDRYRTIVAYGEIDPDFEGKDMLLATSEDGRSLASEGPRLVVPGDNHGGRYVTNVVRVFLEKPPR